MKRDLAVQVGNEGVVQLANATLLAGGLLPSEVGVLRIDRSTEDDGVDGSKVLDVVARGMRQRRGGDRREKTDSKAMISVGQTKVKSLKKQ